MFPYRPVHLNSRVRLLVAAVLAIALHGGLINLEFTHKPVMVPNVSFPRAVNVFLDQNKAGEKMQQKTPEKPAEKDTKKIMPAEPKLESPRKSAKNILTPENRKVEMQPSPVIKEKRARETADVAAEINAPPVEEITQKLPESTNFETEPLPEASKSAEEKIHEIVRDSPSQVSDDDTAKQTVGLVRAYPHYRVNAPPPYPVLARKRGQEGTVLLQVLVTRDGRVDDLKIEDSSGFLLLDRAALAAVKKWRFEPGRQGGKIIPMWVRVPVRFKLKK